jgi:SAM-dependent methyltransferase
MDAELFDLLACPLHQTPLTHGEERLRCARGCSYPILHGVPFLLSRDTPFSDDPWIQGSFAYADKILRGEVEPKGDLLPGEIDPHVQKIVGDTNSALYQSLVGKLASYPIPAFPLHPVRDGDLLLDIGCHWGRWCFAAARNGFNPVGIDPWLEGALAAKRVARQLNLPVRIVVGDARLSPFRPRVFDAAFSYSVLQHFSKEDVRVILRSLGPVMKEGGVTKLHLLNRYGLRSLQVQLAQKARGMQFFDTRYWSPQEMLQTFTKFLGESRLEIDGYFTQGRYEERRLFKLHHRALVEVSETLKKASHRFPLLLNVADNLFVVSQARKSAP